MFICKHCGKEFDTKQQLGGHIIWCDKNSNKSGKSNFTTQKSKIPEEDFGKPVVMMNCQKHGSTEFVLRKDGKYRCRKCSKESVAKRRKLLKSKLIEHKGGKCEICGYDKCVAALEFHHINQKKKNEIKS